MFHMCPLFSHHILSMHAWLARWNGRVSGVFSQLYPLVRCHPTQQPGSLFLPVRKPTPPPPPHTPG